MIPCLFHQLTGLNCPLCGGQRMMWAILHGRFCEAFHHNPLLFCLIPIIIVVLTLWLANKGTRRRMHILYSDRALLLYLVFLILWCIVRNIYGI
ncbi:MAG: DUF2752 domain-containing protein [Bacteroidaceae bacterium]|nr:DUF2752 domain-containing protein [Bacteroidaceae bacterium]